MEGIKFQTIENWVIWNLIIIVGINFHHTEKWLVLNHSDVSHAARHFEIFSASSTTHSNNNLSKSKSMLRLTITRNQAVRNEMLSTQYDLVLKSAEQIFVWRWLQCFLGGVFYQMKWFFCSGDLNDWNNNNEGKVKSSLLGRV